MQKNQIDKIFSSFYKNTPHPKTELESTNIYTLLVAIILSAQATDVGVNKATKSLFSIVSTPEEMLQLGEENLKKHIKTIGLFNSKAKNIIAMSKALIVKHHSQVPNNIISLISLPGVGRKTAKVLLNAAFHKPVIAVDTHVFRTAKRIGLSDSVTIPKVEQDLEKNIPEKWKEHAHNWLVLHGRYICKARKPLCSQCIINQYCEYYRNTKDL
jgi:endonuclease III